MQYTGYYRSPLGDILLAADGIGLTGLWLEGQKQFVPGPVAAPAQAGSPVLAQAVRWLELYFAGREPDVAVPLHLAGTAFQQQVWRLLCAIPYGKTVTYGDIARQVAAARGLARMSAQAVGGAVGRNPVSIIVPCHRVVGADGSLTGYAGGIDKKRWLLQWEQAGSGAALKDG